MAEAAATESFAPLPGSFFGTGFAKGRRGHRQHILHSGAAASRPGAFARRKLDGRAGAPRHAASIESSVVGCQSQVRLERLPGKVQHTAQACPAVLHWGRDAIPYTALQGQAGNQKSSVFWGTLLFVIPPISARPLGARPKRRRPAKARCGGQSPPDSGIAAKSWAPFSKKGKIAAVRWARRQVVIFAASGRG